MNNQPKRNSVRIVITGGPGSGKTEFLKRLRNEPGFEDFLFLEEMARQLLIENPNWRQDWAAFHREIYRRQLEDIRNAGERSFISDRGTADAFAFHPETVIDIGSTLDIEYARYTSVIHLGSSAALGEQYYITDFERTESIADAMSIECAITDVWKNHSGYRFVEAAVDLERKYQEFLRIVRESI